MPSAKPIAAVIVSGIALVTLSAMADRSADAQQAAKARPAPPAGPRLGGAGPFRDDFSRPNTQLWKVSDGWYNGKYMVNDWRASQVRFGKGLELTLAPNRTPKAAFSSGEVQSRAVYGHGYYETRMRAATGSGIVTGFFTYTGPTFGKPWDEIDVEVLGAKPREVMFTYFRNSKKIHKIYQLGFDATQTEHVYGFDWQPGSIRWYVDGKMVHEATGTALPLPVEQQKIMVSLWGSQTLTDWVGPFDARRGPTSALFRCIAFSKDFASRRPC